MDEQANSNSASPGDTLDGTTIFAHNEGLLEASAAFEQQMEQMQRWKQQLAGQMDLLRKDGIKLLERQKKLADERRAVGEEREQVAALKRDLETQVAAVREQQGELQSKIEQAVAQQVEASQLESQRAQVREDLRTAEGMVEEISRRQDQLAGREHELSLRASELEAREKAAVALEQKALVQEVQVREMTEQLELQRRELLASTHKAEDRNRKAEQLEQELADQMMLLAQQTKRLAQRRAELDDTTNVDERIDAITRERDTHEARIGHLVTEINETKAQVATLESESLRLSQQAQRSEELAREKQAAEQRAGVLAAELEKAQAETLALKEQLNNPAAQASSTPDDSVAATLRERCKELEEKLAKTSAQLKETLDFVDLQAAEAALVKSAHEAEAREWQAKRETLETEKGNITGELQALRAARNQGEVAHADGSPVVPARQRGVLVRQVRSLRNKRKQTRELIGTLETTRAELGKQLQQVRVRRDNLEQVKRLLEKQETIMVRKLADHNAIKTVAAVGILLIMILGSTFAGVYRFVNPEYRGEALVQLTPPAEITPDKTEAWLQSQATLLRANATVQQIAWTALRQDGYAMHDTKEAWGLSLPADLTTTVDAASKAIAVRVKGWSADGVAQSSNSLAAAFADVARQKLEPGKDAGPVVPAAAGASVLAKATVPQTPARDQRMMLALSCSGALMGVALIAVLLVRKLISRQLKEIDQMADAKDLEELHDDMPVDTTPA